MEETVLCYIENDNNEYLMLHRVKEDNDMNKGKWLGIGGHLEAHEFPDQALIREVMEETGLKLISYKKRGMVEFVNDDYVEIMHVYTSNQYEGNILECNEGTLKWIKKDRILELNIWEGDKVFLSKIEKNSPFFHIRLIYKNSQFIRSEEL